MQRHEQQHGHDRDRDIGQRPVETDTADLDNSEQRAEQKHRTTGQLGDSSVHAGQRDSFPTPRQRPMTNVTNDQRHSSHDPAGHDRMPRRQAAGQPPNA